jgi:hypothetical protein
MSLDWSVAKVKDWETVTRIIADEDVPMQGIKKGETVLNPITHSLIFSTMAVGIGEITSENVCEFYTRLKLWDLSRGFAEDTPSFEDVKKHIGLKTNVFPKTTDIKFFRSLQIVIAEKDLKSEDRSKFVSDLYTKNRK